eukprot:TRINITY_DN487_c0_g1_i2.p1 TRINITY_DN487_c0_g1~~TRINITY_DN487_c0_g1_i2.p1  ORF type:complete len:752 (-),score=283.03 TRINITY_DN487_c0_g1_i2:107-2206(-)
MNSLDEEAKNAGVILLNEFGVDPGLDLASAQKIIDTVHSRGGKVISFSSICGGLPAPDANNNPFGYKFSWSPRGVLLASRNSALYLKDGQNVSIPGERLFLDGKHDDFVAGVGKLEWYPNRDSIKFIAHHNVPEVRTIVRGTYRYPGWCRLLKSIADLGLTSTERLPYAVAGTSYSAFLRSFLQVAEGVDLKQVVADKLSISVNDEVIAKLEWLGLFSTEETVPNRVPPAPIDILCHLCQTKLVYAPGERDMIVMRHVFEVEYSATHRETIVSTLIDYGLQDKNGHSSMSRTVSLPVAAAARAILEGRINLVGVQRPVIPALYDPILAEMAELGIVFQEEVLKPHFWLRAEVKPGEERSALVPSDVAKLIEAGYRVSVEKSPSCFADEEFERAGATIVEAGSWVNAPPSAIIVGLKHLPEDDLDLNHRHIYFAHCFKEQAGWKELLNRFMRGGGMVWDLEFLVDENGRRVAAFGRAAGIAGMAVAILTWVHQQHGTVVPPLRSWSSLPQMIEDLRAGVASTGKPVPTALVLGALGRVGGGAAWVAEQVGLPVTKWDMEETKHGGPFPELLRHDILANCIYLSGKMNPFLTRDMLEQKDRQLSVFTDISCDVTSPNNPFPIYDRLTSLVEPTLRIIPASDSSKPLDVISIDHLPTLIPNDSSAEFSNLIVPHMLELHNPDSPVWKRAAHVFFSKCQQARD